MTREELIKKAADSGVIFAPKATTIYAVEDGNFFAYANEAYNYVYGSGKNLAIEELTQNDLSASANKTDTSQGKK